MYKFKIVVKNKNNFFLGKLDRNLKIGFQRMGGYGKCRYIFLSTFYPKEKKKKKKGTESSGKYQKWQVWPLSTINSLSSLLLSPTLMAPSSPHPQFRSLSLSHFSRIFILLICFDLLFVLSL